MCVCVRSIGRIRALSLMKFQCSCSLFVSMLLCPFVVAAFQCIAVEFVCNLTFCQNLGCHAGMRRTFARVTSKSGMGASVGRRMSRISGMPRRFHRIMCAGMRRILRRSCVEFPTLRACTRLSNRSGQLDRNENVLFHGISSYHKHAHVAGMENH